MCLAAGETRHQAGPSSDTSQLQCGTRSVPSQSVPIRPPHVFDKNVPGGGAAEGRVASEQDVQDHARAKHIGLAAVAIFAQDLGSCTERYAPGVCG